MNYTVEEIEELLNQAAIELSKEINKPFNYQEYRQKVTELLWKKKSLEK